jgi:hypothetical protein
MYEDLKSHLEVNKYNLRGAWVAKKDQYENYICGALFMSANKSRYWDARWNEYYLEFKKGKSVWLDLVRYSEILLKLNPSVSHQVLNLFFIPNINRSSICEILCVETNTLINTLRLTNIFANQLIELNKNIPRSLNAQASLTINDLRQISVFIINCS